MKRGQSTDPTVTLKIPRPLYERLKVVIEGSGFHSVTEFAVYVLRDLVSHHAAGDAIPGVLGRTKAQDAPQAPAPAPAPDVDPLSPQEIEAIRQRLESLGYL